MKRRLSFLALFALVLAFVVVDTIVMHPYINKINDLRVPLYLVRAVIYTGLLAAPAFAFGQKARWFYIPFFCYRFFVCCMTVWVLCKFKMKLDGDWILIVGTSSWEETSAFLKESFPWWTIGVIFLCGGALSCGVRLWYKIEYPRVCVRNFIFGLCAAVPFALCVCHSGLGIEELVRASAGMIAWDTKRKIDMYSKLNRACVEPELPVRMETVVPTNELPTVVIVIGESATRNRWHLYGYPLKTTERMDAIADELIVFKDVEAVEPYTVAALRLLMTCAKVECQDDFRFTLPAALKRGGWSPAVYSMCTRWGCGFGSISVLFSGCDEVLFVAEARGGPADYDELLLPYLRNGLKTHDCIFLHTLGSHYPYGCHVPPDFRTPEIAGKLDRYDESISYTDWFLHEVVCELRKLNRPALMIYLSDHGETPESGTWRDVSSKSCWEIPMVVWFSNRYRDRFPEIVESAREASVKPMRSDELIGGVMRLCGLKLQGQMAVDDFLEGDWRSARQKD